MAAIASTPSPTWITPKKAAEALGVSERSVYNLCEANKLGYEVQRVKGRKPFRMVNAADVERMIGSQVRPMLVSEAPATTAPAVQERTFEDGARLMATILKSRELSAAPKPWLTLDEAAEYSGLPKAYLLTLARGGCDLARNVGTEKRASWRFNRDALAR